MISRACVAAFRFKFIPHSIESAAQVSNHLALPARALGTELTTKLAKRNNVFHSSLEFDDLPPRSVNFTTACSNTAREARAWTLVMSAQAKAAIGNELAPIIDLDTLRHHIAQRFDPPHQGGSVAT